MNKEIFIAEYRDRVTCSVGKFRLSISETNVLYYYIQGEGRLIFFVNDKLLELHSGEVIFIKKGTLFGAIKKNPVRYTRLVSYFPSSLTDYLGKYDNKIAETVLFNGAKIFRPDRKTKEKLLDLAKGNSERSLRDGEAISVIVKELSLLSSSGSNKEEKAKPNTDLLSDIFVRINEDYKNLASATDLATALSYSPNYISEYFKKKMNMSLHEFLIFKKLSVAITKMSEGMNVTDAAYESGFSSTSHFIEIFKRHYYLTPKQFFKKIVEN